MCHELGVLHRAQILGAGLHGFLSVETHLLPTPRLNTQDVSGPLAASCMRYYHPLVSMSCFLFWTCNSGYFHALLWWFGFPARFRRGIRARASDRLGLYLQLRCTCFSLSSSEDQILEQTQCCCPRECFGRTGMCSVDWAPEMRAGVMRACMCHWISFSEFK